MARKTYDVVNMKNGGRYIRDLQDDERVWVNKCAVLSESGEWTIIRNSNVDGMTVSEAKAYFSEKYVRYVVFKEHDHD